MKQLLLHILILFILLSSCTQSHGLKESKIRKAQHEIKEFRAWFSELVKTVPPDIIIEMPCLKSSNLGLGNLIHYEMFNISKSYHKEINNGLNGLASDSDFIDPYQKSIDTFFESFNEDSLVTLLKHKHIFYKELHILLPILTDSVIANSDSVNEFHKYLIKRRIEDKRRVNSNRIKDLVSSQLFLEGFNSKKLPTFFVDSIRARFEFIKSYVSEPYFKAIKKTNLIIVDSNSQFIPTSLGVRNVNGDILISSLLLRAVFIDLAYKYCYNVINYTNVKTEYNEDVIIIENNKLNAYEISKSKNQRVQGTVDRIEMQIAHDNFYANLYKHLDFVLLHELAHIFLGRLTFDESLCDCHAYLTLKNITPNADTTTDLGVFYYYLMNGAVENPELWFDTSNTQIVKQLRSRYSKLVLNHKNRISCN